ncbi:MAG: ATP-dependent zinc metalloprotease FtsH [Hyphomicrobiales bacterium]|nr:ATP-dependent zinc metalloprotease FtsH [Hyphomicrobiales bacterium]
MANHSKPPNNQEPDTIRRWTGFILLAFSISLMFSLYMYSTDTGLKTVSYSEIKNLIITGQVSRATLAQHSIEVQLTDNSVQKSPQLRAVVPIDGNAELLLLLEKHKVEVTAVAPSEGSFITYLLPWVLILGFYYWMTRRMSGGLSNMPGGMKDLLGGRFSKPSKQTKRVTFDDVAGQDMAKREVSELVDFLRDPERFQNVGAEVPHGVLLMGPPGTGKTLLARALAGEAEVPFFSTSGSEFIEVFVGVGAGRVRKMFEEARKQAPSIIFIDELDSIGRTRGTGLGGGHDEREQTLNQILAELDGFSPREAVVVLAATNRPDVLDPALLRPGRFDRHVTLSLPDKLARLAILKIHAKDLPLGTEIELSQVAAGTPGFSGADLKNLLNEAAITAARRRAAKITVADIDEARDKIVMGTVRTLAIQPEEKHRLAVHEAGHTAAAFFNSDADPVYKVTIIPRGRSLGGTHMLPEKERHTLAEDYLRTQLVVLLAGRAAEKLLLGSVSSGADDDIRRATDLARSMVAKWGMDSELGPVNLRESEDHPFLGQKISQPRSFSDSTAARVDNAVITLLTEADKSAVRLLKSHRKGMEILVKHLETEETLDATAIQDCLESGLKVSKPAKKLPLSKTQSH